MDPVKVAGSTVAGNETSRIFIETGRFHGEAIVKRLRAAGAVILGKTNFLFGVGVVENAHDQTALIEAVPVETLFKREAGVKDSGRFFPGIGGILDLLDSLLFNAPLMYLYLRHVLT